MLINTVDGLARYVVEWCNSQKLIGQVSEWDNFKSLYLYTGNVVAKFDTSLNTLAKNIDPNLDVTILPKTEFLYDSIYTDKWAGGSFPEHVVDNSIFIERCKKMINAKDWANKLAIPCLEKVVDSLDFSWITSDFLHNYFPEIGLSAVRGNMPASLYLFIKQVTKIEKIAGTISEIDGADTLCVIQPTVVTGGEIKLRYNPIFLVRSMVDSIIFKSMSSDVPITVQQGVMAANYAAAFLFFHEAMHCFRGDFTPSTTQIGRALNYIISEGAINSAIAKNLEQMVPNGGVTFAVVPYTAMIKEGVTKEQLLDFLEKKLWNRIEANKRKAPVDRNTSSQIMQRKVDSIFQSINRILDGVTTFKGNVSLVLAVHGFSNAIYDSMRLLLEDGEKAGIFYYNSKAQQEQIKKKLLEKAKEQEALKYPTFKVRDIVTVSSFPNEIFIVTLTRNTKANGEQDVTMVRVSDTGILPEEKDLYPIFDAGREKTIKALTSATVVGKTITEIISSDTTTFKDLEEVNNVANTITKIGRLPEPPKPPVKPEKPKDLEPGDIAIMNGKKYVVTKITDTGDVIAVDLDKLDKSQLKKVSTAIDAAAILLKKEAARI